MTQELGTTLPRLVADIGGTNARFALLNEHNELFAERVLACAEYPTLAAAIETYLDGTQAERPKAAAIAVATFTTRDRIKLTNHVWEFSVSQTRIQLGFDFLRVINDFTALALSLAHLPAADLRQVGGTEANKNSAVALLGPGTGLGVSGLVYTAHGWYPVQGEGGHVSYGPLTKQEEIVCAYVQQQRGHVSAERLLSGQGLVNIYQALRQSQGNQADDLTQAALITERGLNGQCELCVETLHLFCTILGTVAGNLALTLGAKSGVYIGGGIVPRLGNFFEQSGFYERFQRRGRFTEYLSEIPVYLITARTPALIGSAQAFDPFYASVGVSSITE